jgi:hypothetical protein
MIGIIEHLPLRKSSRLCDTLERLSVAMHMRNLSNDATFTRGICVRTRPKEDVRVGISCALQQWGGNSNSSNQTLNPNDCCRRPNKE